MSLRLAVDVGGTNTDAVLLHGDSVIGLAKCRTSADVLSGIQSAVKAALAGSNVGAFVITVDTSTPDVSDMQRMSTDASVLAADSADVSACMLGTTHFVNACVQCRGLARVAVFRLCGPATRALPPCCDIPVELRSALEIQHQLLDGMYLVP